MRKPPPVFGEDPRRYHVLTKAFIDDGEGGVSAVRTVEVDWSQPGERAPFREVPGSEKDCRLNWCCWRPVS